MRHRYGWTLRAALTLAAAWTTNAALAQEHCDHCRTGRNQSPVRLERILAAPHAPGPRLQHAAENVQIVDNGGKNLMVRFPQASRNTLSFDERGAFPLSEFHLHAPGEHPQGSGPVPPLEIHFVHDQAGALAVVGVAVSIAQQTHPLLRRVLDALPAGAQSGTLDALDPQALRFHAGRPLLRYAGSLTTGTCDEGVSWFVYDTSPRAPLSISATDLKRYTDRFPPYARDPQGLHARVVVRGGAPVAVP